MHAEKLSSHGVGWQGVSALVHTHGVYVSLMLWDSSLPDGYDIFNKRSKFWEADGNILFHSHP